MPTTILHRSPPLVSSHTALPTGQRWMRGLVALVGAVLLADAVVLMLLRHFHVGVLVPGVLGGIGLLLGVYWPQLRHWRAQHARRRWLWRAGWIWLALWLLSVALSWRAMAGVGLAPSATPPVQAIVVLGSGTQNGRPRPALAARLDTAAELARLQPHALIAVCGGVDWGETESEALVMAHYLVVEHGIAPERIVQEGESTSTELNLLLSRPLLQARGIAASAPQAVVSSDFHLLRAMAIARQQGLSHAVAVAAPTPLATRYNAWLREYFAWGSSWLLGEMQPDAAKV